jgi:NADPH:quinone reductase-like Zn-dependent oxidoreductase
MATMKAVRVHGFGGPDRLAYEDAPRPEPKAGEVSVKVEAAGGERQKIFSLREHLCKPRENQLLFRRRHPP